MPARGNLRGVTPKRAAVLVPFALLAGACDSATVYEDCASDAKIGTGEERCLPSLFPKEDRLARSIAGFVTYGIERVPNAIVRVDDMFTTTDAAGLYRFDAAPFRYDVLAVTDRDVVFYRGAAQRVLDLSLDRDVVPRAWTGRIALTVANGPQPGHGLAFFASGDVVGLSGDLATGIVLASRSFDISARVHVVEYPLDVGIAGAVGKGSVDVRVTSGRVAAAEVELFPIEGTESTSFVAEPPPGFVAGEVEVMLDFGSRFSESIARKVPLGTRIELPIMEDARWTARVAATREGAVASSGRFPFAPGPEIGLTLFDAPESVSSEGGVLTARGTGVLEHVLEPSGGGRTVHIVTAERSQGIPDLASVGFPRLSGDYTWTVRHFPDFSFVDKISGIDVRLYRATSTSAPRAITLP